MINSVEIVEQRDDIYNDEDSDDANIELPEGLAPEERKPWPDLFIITASEDWDILLHRLSNGVKVIQFAQDNSWNIYDMKPYEKIRPNYVRDWLKEKKQKWIGMINDRIKSARDSGELAEETKVPEIRISTKDQLKKLGININFSEIGDPEDELY